MGFETLKVKTRKGARNKVELIFSDKFNIILFKIILMWDFPSLSLDLGTIFFVKFSFLWNNL